MINQEQTQQIQNPEYSNVESRIPALLQRGAAIGLLAAGIGLSAATPSHSVEHVTSDPGVSAEPLSGATDKPEVTDTPEDQPGLSNKQLLLIIGGGAVAAAMIPSRRKSSSSPSNDRPSPSSYQNVVIKPVKPKSRDNDSGSGDLGHTSWFGDGSGDSGGSD